MVTQLRHCQLPSNARNISQMFDLIFKHLLTIFVLSAKDDFFCGLNILLFSIYSVPFINNSIKKICLISFFLLMVAANFHQTQKTNLEICIFFI